MAKDKKGKSSPIASTRPQKGKILRADPFESAKKKTGKGSQKKGSTAIIDLDFELQQQNLQIQKKSDGIAAKISSYAFKLKLRFLQDLRRRREERLTLMMIPHNEQSIRNYHVTNLNLTIFLTILGLVVFASALFIINHTSTIQEVDQLKVSQEDAQIQFGKIRKEIQEISQTYETVKGYIDKLYLSSGLGKSTIFAKGGNSETGSAAEQAAKNLISENTLQKTSEIEKIPLEIFMLNRIVDDMNLAEKPLSEIESFLKKRKNVINNAPTLWPVRGFIVNPYGNIKNALTMENEFNYGIDIASSPNAEVLVTAPGIVTAITRENEWGWKIKIRHKYGYVTIYRGLERVTVSNDEKVTKGDRLGYIGRPRNSIESILHYEIYVGTEAQNPLPYLGYVGD